MIKQPIKNSLLKIATFILLTLFIGACNDADKDSKEKKKDEVSANDAAKEASVKAKKKGKASVSKKAANSNAVKVKKDKDGVYTAAEIMPVYPGNDQALSDYISSNINYPDDALNNNIEGTVNIAFVIDADGTISDVKTTGDKIGYGLEEEAVSVVSKLPKWTPGKVKGKNVKTRLNIPITYKMES